MGAGNALNLRDIVAVLEPQISEGSRIVQMSKFIAESIASEACAAESVLGASFVVIKKLVEIGVLEKHCLSNFWQLLGIDETNPESCERCKFIEDMHSHELRSWIKEDIDIHDLRLKVIHSPTARLCVECGCVREHIYLETEGHQEWEWRCSCCDNVLVLN